MRLGPTLDPHKFELHTGTDGENNIWIAKSAKIANDVHLCGPLIVDHGTEIRHGAFILGKVIIGKNCVIGNSTEIKNSVILDNVQLPHYNYIGDYVELGCICVVNPGTVIGKNTILYPLSCVRGIIGEDCIVSTKITITKKERK